jgi:hypothetical protein
MSKPWQRILVVVGALAGLGLVVVAGLAWRLAADAKPRVESMASEALGMEVTVGGPLTVGVLHGLHLALADVRVRRCGADVASAAEVDFGLELLPLLHQEIRIEAPRLKGLHISVEPGRGEALRVDQACRADSSISSFGTTRIVVSDSSLRYTDRASGKYLEATQCAGEISALSLSGGAGRSIANNVALAANVACAQVRTKELTASDVKFAVHGENGIFDFDRISMQLLGGQGSGTVHADYSGAVALYQLRYRVAQIRVDEAFRALSLGTSGQGALDFSAVLSLRGATADEWLRTLTGEASLHGAELKLEVGDLDEKFARYESSQNFNLVDLGALFFLGPVGVGVTKGLDFARAFQGASGSTTFPLLVSEWHVEQGVAHAKDVAMTTRKNRIALKGGLDFVAGQFTEVTVALLDAQGCATVQQRVSGPFLAPQVAQPNVLRSLTGPTRRLLGRARSVLGGKCEVFYAGSVAPPP